MPSYQLKASLAMIALLLTAPTAALAQGQGAQKHHPGSESGSTAPFSPERGMMQGVMPERGAIPMMDGSGTGMGMMDCPMMSQMMRMHPEMMAMMHDQMGPGGRMMGQGSGPGTMMGQDSRSGMTMRPGGMGLDSGVVTPIQHLSADDVRHYFEHRLRQLGNARLKLGEVAQTNDDVITVDIVTADDSLVDRLEVDLHSGAIQRAQ